MHQSQQDDEVMDIIEGFQDQEANPSLDDYLDSRRINDDLRSQVLAAWRSMNNAVAMEARYDEFNASSCKMSETIEVSVTQKIEFIERIAYGGQGEIYRVRMNDGLIVRELALKTARDDRSGSKQSFENELSVLSQLQHPNLIYVHNSGFLPGRRQYYTMKLNAGKTFAEAIKEFHRKGGNRDLLRSRHFRFLMGYLIKLCDLLAFTHQRGFLHCDVKPENVLLGDLGDCLLADWGLARRFRNVTAGHQDVPEALPRFGTPGFMSPEYCAGGALDQRSDIYSIGVFLRQLTTGSVSNEREASSEARDLKIPPKLDAIYRKCTALDPSDRYQSCSEVSKDLRNWLDDGIVTAWKPTICQSLSERWNRCEAHGTIYWTVLFTLLSTYYFFPTLSVSLAICCIVFASFRFSISIVDRVRLNRSVQPLDVASAYAANQLVESEASQGLKSLESATTDDNINQYSKYRCSVVRLAMPIALSGALLALIFPSKSTDTSQTQIGFSGLAEAGVRVEVDAYERSRNPETKNGFENYLPDHSFFRRHDATAKVFLVVKKDERAILTKNEDGVSDHGK